MMETLKWDEIYTQLLAFADYMLKTHGWFRNTTDGTYLKGKEASDYVMEAIERHLRYPEKYDSSLNLSLLNYLKSHIIRRLISNDANSKENKISFDIFGLCSNDDDDEPFINVENLMPVTEAFFDQEIDYRNFLTVVRQQLCTDVIGSKIFEGIVQNSKRREIIMDNNMSSVDFDSGMKRLKTVLKRTAKKLELIKG